MRKTRIYSELKDPRRTMKGNHLYPLEDRYFAPLQQ